MFTIVIELVVVSVASSMPSFSQKWSNYQSSPYFTQLFNLRKNKFY